MVDPLRLSTQFAGEMTARKLPYLNQAAGMGIPQAIEGFATGQALAQRQQQMQMQADAALMEEARHEIELQDLNLRVALHQQELSVRGQQAQVQMAEAQAALVDRDVRRKMAEEDQQFDISKSLVTLPPQPLQNGKWMVFEMGPTGRHRSVEVDASDPRVADLMAQREATSAQADLDRARAEDARRNPFRDPLQGSLASIGRRITDIQAEIADERSRAKWLTTPQERKASADRIQEMEEQLRFYTERHRLATERLTSGQQGASPPQGGAGPAPQSDAPGPFSRMFDAARQAIANAPPLPQAFGEAIRAYESQVENDPNKTMLYFAETKFADLAPAAVRLIDRYARDRPDGGSAYRRGLSVALVEAYRRASLSNVEEEALQAVQEQMATLMMQLSNPQTAEELMGLLEEIGNQERYQR